MRPPGTGEAATKPLWDILNLVIIQSPLPSQGLHVEHVLRVRVIGRYQNAKTQLLKLVLHSRSHLRAIAFRWKTESGIMGTKDVLERGHDHEFNGVDAQ